VSLFTEAAAPEEGEREMTHAFGDDVLVREIRAGSGVAFAQLMHRYERLVHRVAYGFVGDRDEALDVVQETFLKVHSRLHEWRGEGEIRNWIARIAANEAMNRSRSRRLHAADSLEEDRLEPSAPTQDSALRDREARGALQRSLAVLPPRQRLAVVLRYYQEMSTREIASVLECSEGTARNILFRSLQKLRSVLKESEGVVP
jgi:RNA polymerase sigma-70 factor (ECF subfamily)